MESRNLYLYQDVLSFCVYKSFLFLKTEVSHLKYIYRLISAVQNMTLISKNQLKIFAIQTI